MPYLVIFGLEFEKAIVIFQISILKFIRKESLNNIVNFGVGSTFSEGSGSTFPKGPVPDLCPLCKV